MDDPGRREPRSNLFQGIHPPSGNLFETVDRAARRLGLSSPLVAANPARATSCRPTTAGTPFAALPQPQRPVLAERGPVVFNLTNYMTGPLQYWDLAMDSSSR